MESTPPNTSCEPHLVLPTTLRQNYYAQDGGNTQPRDGAIYTRAQDYLKGRSIAKPHSLHTETRKDYTEMREDNPTPVTVSNRRAEIPERDCIPKWNAEPKVYNHLGNKQDDRYRHIEDLAQYLNGPQTDTASYFNDPMRRRAAERSANEAQLVKSDNVILTGEVDPRHAMMEEKAAEDRSAVIPSKALESKHKFETTTGQVKPYVLKHSNHTTEKLDAPCNHRAMEEYITQMQCQRPTKGVYAPH